MQTGTPSGFRDILPTEAVAREPGFKNMFRGAPNLICVCAPKDGGFDLDAGLMGQNMMLAAQSLGLGTCIQTGPVRFLLQSEGAKPFLQRLDIPDGYKLLYVIAVGYPDETPDAKPRDASKVKFIGASNAETSEDDGLFIDYEENAQFPGGDPACFKWIADNIKYPKDCMENGIEGRVIVNFAVEKDGSITDVKTMRSPDPSLTKEAERLIKAMPKFKPATQMGKPVRSRFTLPIVFRLGEDGKVK